MKRENYGNVSQISHKNVLHQTSGFTDSKEAQLCIRMWRIRKYWSCHILWLKKVCTAISDRKLYFTEYFFETGLLFQNNFLCRLNAQLAKMKNIVNIIFPPNYTDISQFCDLRIIKSFKVAYRWLVQKALFQLKSCVDSSDQHK